MTYKKLRLKSSLNVMNY